MWTTDKTRVFRKEQQVMINKLEEKMMAIADRVVESGAATEARVNKLINLHRASMVVMAILIALVVTKCLG